MGNRKTANKSDAKESAVSWTNHAWEEYLSWQGEDPKIVQEINHLIAECLKDPFKGTGKPEPLKGNLTGFWSRRITREHRLVYLPEDRCIYIVQCRFHY
jgi:toxin YoeB